MTEAEERVRALCLALPEATEKTAWGDPTFRVRDKIFAMLKRGQGAEGVWMKAPAGAQEVLIGADPDRFFRPPYVGHKGWIGVRLEPAPDWIELERLLTRSWRMTAPKRLAAKLPDPDPPE
ncbi:MAG: MmcQ/YjbR family DNA-binding protein [Pseudomonadota bacterium]